MGCLSVSVEGTGETLYAVYLAAYEDPQPPEYRVLRDIFPDASEVTIDEAADAVTIGAIHGAAGDVPLSPDELGWELAQKDRDLLNSASDTDDGEP